MMHRALSIVAAAAASRIATAYDNGSPTLRPLLGWESWCSVGPCRTDLCTERQVMETVRALRTTGLFAKGYKWVVLDNCWHPTRSAKGRLVPDPDRFPSGMKHLAGYVHGHGMKFGLYTSAGARTCHHAWAPGSYGHFDTDARTFASWKLDYVKLDWCDRRTRREAAHFNLSRALNATGRPVVLELCRGPYIYRDEWGYARDVAQIWRAARDHHDDFASTLKQAPRRVVFRSSPRRRRDPRSSPRRHRDPPSQVAALENATRLSGPHGWAYGDILMTGGQGCSTRSGLVDPYTGIMADPSKPSHCPKQSEAEYRTEVTLYAILQSPLFLGTDPRNFTKLMADLLLNDDMLFVNQDYKAEPAVVTSSCGRKAYIRRLSDGRVAFGATNLERNATAVGICFDEFFRRHGPAPAAVRVKDVWARTTSTHACCGWGNYSRDLAPHDTMFLLLDPRPLQGKSRP